MNKTDLIKAVASKTGLTQDITSKTLDALLEEITICLKQGTAVALIGFGTFKVSPRAARDGRNPKTGDVIKIPASIAPTFSAGKSLKDAVNS